ncbi:MAG: hypothetical protein P8Y53_18380 [Pseudolabrys sp.]
MFSQAAVPVMRGKGGVIINIGSISSLMFFSAARSAARLRLPTNTRSASERRAGGTMPARQCTALPPIAAA